MIREKKTTILSEILKGLNPRGVEKTKKFLLNWIISEYVSDGIRYMDYLPHIEIEFFEKDEGEGL